MLGLKRHTNILVLTHVTSRVHTQSVVLCKTTKSREAILWSVRKNLRFYLEDGKANTKALMIIG